MVKSLAVQPPSIGHGGGGHRRGRVGGEEGGQRGELVDLDELLRRLVQQHIADHVGFGDAVRLRLSAICLSTSGVLT